MPRFRVVIEYTTPPKTKQPKGLMLAGGTPEKELEYWKSVFPGNSYMRNITHTVQQLPPHNERKAK
jgi:hypothetical protein